MHYINKLPRTFVPIYNSMAAFGLVNLTVPSSNPGAGTFYWEKLKFWIDFSENGRFWENLQIWIDFSDLSLPGCSVRQLISYM